VDAIRRRGHSRILIVTENRDADFGVHETRWPGVWAAEVPRLTELLGAGRADYVAWNRILLNFGRVPHGSERGYVADNAAGIRHGEPFLHGCV
jgi:hypothetical protein